jgi:hypothetical protein
MYLIYPQFVSPRAKLGFVGRVDKHLLALFSLTEQSYFLQQLL